MQCIHMFDFLFVKTINDYLLFLLLFIILWNKFFNYSIVEVEHMVIGLVGRVLTSHAVSQCSNPARFDCKMPSFTGFFR